MTTRTIAAMLACAALAPLSGCAVAASGDTFPPAAAPPAAYADACGDWDDWDKPAPPFRIHGNSYYVGTCGISAILVTGSEGHILIDTGSEAGADAVLASVAELGFAPGDIRILLISHEHYDHVGGAARVAERTRARVIAGPVAAGVLESGNVGADDALHGEHPAMRPVPRVEVIAPGAPVRLGDIALTMVPTPGHTLGAASWQWRACEDGDCRTVVYADSLTPVSAEGYRFTDHPDRVATFRQSIAAVAALDCDILMTPHPSASAMRQRIVEGSLARSGACSAYAAQVSAGLDARLAKEAGQ